MNDRVIIDSRTPGKWWYERSYNNTDSKWRARLELWKECVAAWQSSSPPSGQPGSPTT